MGAIMTVSAGSNPERTRPDQHLPERPDASPPPAEDVIVTDPLATPVPPPSPPVQPAVTPPSGGLGTAARPARRRDMWFVPPLAGWMAGFAMFAVLDVLKGRWGGLLEHVLYLAGFVVLLFLSYGLSAKAQLAAAVRVSGEVAGAGPREGRLTRTQEFALSAVNRLPHR